MRKILSNVLIIVGVLLLLGAAGTAIYNVWDDERAGEEVDSVLRPLEEEMDPEIFGDPDENGDGLTDDQRKLAAYASQKLWEMYPETPMPSVEINGKRYSGVLKVPSLHLELPVMETWSYPNLRKAPCIYSGSAYLHNLTICGHNYSRHFGRLHSLKSGTEITFTDMAQNVFYYEVIAVEILEPTAVEEMSVKTDEDTWDMTLFTCTVGGRSRYAIRCGMVR